MFEKKKKKTTLKRHNIVITGGPFKMDLSLSLHLTPHTSFLRRQFVFLHLLPTIHLLPAVCAPAPLSPPGTSRQTGPMSLIALKSPSSETQTSAFSQGLYLDSDKKIAVITFNYLLSFKTAGNENRK